MEEWLGSGPQRNWEGIRLWSNGEWLGSGPQRNWEVFRLWSNREWLSSGPQRNWDELRQWSSWRNDWGGENGIFPCLVTPPWVLSYPVTPLLDHSLSPSQFFSTQPLPFRTKKNLQLFDTPPSLHSFDPLPTTHNVCPFFSFMRSGSHLIPPPPQ